MGLAVGALVAGTAGLVVAGVVVDFTGGVDLLGCTGVVGVVVVAAGVVELFDCAGVVVAGVAPGVAVGVAPVVAAPLPVVVLGVAGVAGKGALLGGGGIGLD